MPAIYAHYSFGQKVFKQLPDDLKEIIKKYEDLFIIGLQGPDLFFYYKPLAKNKINAIGNELHRQEASSFLEKGRKILQDKGKDSKECAYLLGFICHFMLDSCSHFYVDQQIEETGIGHIEIESEFEKHLMKKDGLDPIGHKIGEFIVVSKDASEHIAPFYACTAKDIYDSLKSMRLIKNILVAKHLPKRLFLRFVMKLSMQYDSLQGHLYKLKMNPKLLTSNNTLEKLLNEEVEPTKKMMIDFYQKIDTHLPLNSRFNKDFE